TRRRQRTERVGHTVGAGLLPLGDALQPPVQPDREARALLGQQPRLPVAALACGLHRGPAPPADQPPARRSLGGTQEEAAGRRGGRIRLLAGMVRTRWWN